MPPGPLQVLATEAAAAKMVREVAAAEAALLQTRLEAEQLSRQTLEQQHQQLQLAHSSATAEARAAACCVHTLALAASRLTFHPWQPGTCVHVCNTYVQSLVCIPADKGTPQRD